ncbi:hypothetical protein GCM10028805_48440 [Spirosoma harenae]
MKALTFLLTSISFLAMFGQAFSQDVGAVKPLNNPMYSSHNYKHPNLAAAARRSETKGGIVVQSPKPNENQFANYKNQNPGVQPTGGVTVEHTPSASLADRNYKIQRTSEPTPTSNEYYVKSRRKRVDSTAVGQD